MNRFTIMAEIFYRDDDKLKKALDAAKLLDNRLSSNYRHASATTDIHFDMPSFLAYFSYEKLSLVKDYENKNIEYIKKAKAPSLARP